MKVTAKATRSGSWWAIEVPEVPGTFTQARRLDQVAAMVADAVSLMTNVPEADVEVEVVPDMGEASVMLRAVLEASTEAVDAQARASKLTREAVAQLRSSGLTTRDVATLLKVSPQRVSQLQAS